MGIKQPKYLVHFTGTVYTAPDSNNPKGVRVKASGHIVVDGPRPKSSFDIPHEVIVKAKNFFMEQTKCIRYAGDEPGKESFPSIRLGKALK